MPDPETDKILAEFKEHLEETREDRDMEAGREQQMLEGKLEI